VNPPEPDECNLPLDLLVRREIVAAVHRIVVAINAEILLSAGIVICLSTDEVETTSLAPYTLPL
jgi:hypothetical protein